MSKQLAELIKKRNDAHKALGIAKFKKDRKRLLKRIDGLGRDIELLIDKEKSQ